ncbi:hypothetical protein QO004_004274 [Rhizobium mesoamericanum]|nr:hypothetical protein [Rhizobium mesoamericanum]
MAEAIGCLRDTRATQRQSACRGTNCELHIEEKDPEGALLSHDKKQRSSFVCTGGLTRLQACISAIGTHHLFIQ